MGPYSMGAGRGRFARYHPTAAFRGERARDGARHGAPARIAKLKDNGGTFGLITGAVFANVGVDGTLSRFSTLRSWAC